MGKSYEINSLVILKYSNCGVNCEGYCSVMLKYQSRKLC